MNRLLVGFPLSYSIPSAFFSNWLNMDHSPLVGAVTVTTVYVQQSMEIIVERALTRDDWDRLVILEHDMIAPPHAFTHIASYAPDLDIVGSMYFARQPPHYANVLMEGPKRKFDPISAATAAEWCADPGLFKVDAVAFGLTSISRHVLTEWDQKIPMFAIDETFGSHDLWFSYHAREQGFGIFVDTGIRCGHLSELAVTLEDNQRWASVGDTELTPFTTEKS